MFLSAWRHSPRLLQIQVANTAIAEGLHSLSDRLVALQLQIAEDRKQLPLEAIPQATLIGAIAEKAGQCAEQVSRVRDQTADASASVHRELTRISESLAALTTQLAAMKERDGVRSYSFDPIVALIKHAIDSLRALEKGALAANKRRFWPWGLLGGSFFLLGVYLLFTPSASSLLLFGNSSVLHIADTILLSFLAMIGSIGGTARAFYNAYLPKSKNASDPNLPFRFWVWSCLCSYGVALSITMLFVSWQIVQWLGSNDPDNSGGIIALAVVLLIASAIGLVVTLITHWDDFRA